MSLYSDESLLEVLNWRYATKLFQRGALISDELWTTLENALALTASAYGLQPWKFVVITNPALKKTLLPQTVYQAQIEDCSHYVVFCAREKIDDEWVGKYVTRYAEVRGVPSETLDAYRRIVHSDLVNGRRSGIAFEWATRQCFIALGNFMTSAAILGIDTCAIEGFAPDAYDRILKLHGTGWKSVICCAAGYRSFEDVGAELPKVRFSLDDLFDRR